VIKRKFSRDQKIQARHGWLTPIILTTRETAWVNSSARPYLEKPFTKIGLVEWLKMKALSSSPSTAKKKEKKRKYSPQISSSKFIGKVILFWIN
jgi:hypothetical protein